MSLVAGSRYPTTDVDHMLDVSIRFGARGHLLGFLCDGVQFHGHRDRHLDRPVQGAWPRLGRGNGKGGRVPGERCPLAGKQRMRRRHHLTYHANHDPLVSVINLQNMRRADENHFGGQVSVIEILLTAVEDQRPLVTQRPPAGRAARAGRSGAGCDVYVRLLTCNLAVLAKR